MSCDEEQVCLMIKQVQVKAISDGGYGPFSNIYLSIYQFYIISKLYPYNFTGPEMYMRLTI